MDDATAATRLSTGGTCGADCNLTNNSTGSGVTQDTTNFVEGIASASFADADAEILTCTHAVCGDTAELSVNGSVTYLCYTRKTVDGTGSSYIFNKLTGNNGYRMTRDNDNDRITCTAGNGSAAADSSAINSHLVNNWYHAACVFNDTTNELEAFVDAVGSGSPATLTSLGTGATTFAISTSTIGWEGQTDNCVVYPAAFDDAELCRDCSCMTSGELCSCDPTEPTNYKPCTVDADCREGTHNVAICDTTNGTCSGYNTGSNPGCRGCTLTACNAAMPS